MSNNFQKVRVVKLFASSEYKIRNKAYKTIKFLLKLEFGNDKKQLSENDVLAIWKGLYVWLWMQDKPILHEEVVEKISALLPMILSEKLALEFIKGFFITVNREWPKLDAHRLDKYYMLVRDMLNSCLKWLQEKEWRYFEEWLGILRENILVPSNTRALGLKLHFFDIILDELVKINAESFVVTRTVAEIILSLSTTNSQNIYFSKVCKRVVDRLAPLRTSGNLDIDLASIAEFLLGAATAKREMSGKTRKFFYRLAERFQQEAKPTCETMETDENLSVAMETAIAATAVEAHSAEQQRDEKTANLDSQEDPQQPEASADQSEAAQPESLESAAPASVCSPPQKPARKAASENHTKPARTSNGESDSERRVTFGKRYTKKFTKATTTIGVSVGTVKQQEIKSILKRKST